MNKYKSDKKKLFKETAKKSNEKHPFMFSFSIVFFLSPIKSSLSFRFFTSADILKVYLAEELKHKKSIKNKYGFLRVQLTQNYFPHSNK